jgi:hypothetical protein
MKKNNGQTLMRRLRQVKHPVLVRRLISFLFLPPDIMRPLGAGRWYRNGWPCGDEVTLRWGGACANAWGGPGTVK